MHAIYLNVLMFIIKCFNQGFIEFFFIIEPLNFESSRSIDSSASTTAVILNDNYELKSDNLTLYDDYKKYSTNNLY